MKLKRNDLLAVAFILDELLDKYDIYKYSVEGNELSYWVVGIEYKFVLKFRE